MIVLGCDTLTKWARQFAPLAFTVPVNTSAADAVVAIVATRIMVTAVTSTRTDRPG